MGTKNQSPGSQFTPRGVVQGFSLVSHEYGRPIDSIIDSSGVLRLAVDSIATIDNAVINVDLDHTTDSIAIGNGVSNIMSVNNDGTLNIRLFDENGAAFTSGNPLPVNVISGGSGGFQILDGQLAVPASDLGTIAAGFDGANYQFLQVNAAGRLQVDIVGGGGSAGQLVQDGQVVVGTDVGRIMAGSDGINYQHLKVDSNGELQVDVLSLPNVVLASQVNPFTTNLPVSINAFTTSLPVGTNNIGDVDVLTLPNVILASQANPFTTPLDVQALNFDIRDLVHTADSIKVGDGVDFLAINTDGSALVDVIDRAARDLGKVRITDGTNEVDIINDGGVFRLRVDAKIAAGGASQDVHPVDAVGNNLDLVDDIARPTGPFNRVLMIAGHDESNIVRSPNVSVDTEDGKHRMEVAGKFSLSPPSPPAATTPVTIDGGIPLNLSGNSTVEWIIPNGETFTLTQVIAGAEGDPTEKGTKVEISYVDASSVAHLITRVYLTGFTTEVYPNTSKARDGASIVGNGTTTKVRIYREQFGGGTREVDVVVRGYY